MYVLTGLLLIGLLCNLALKPVAEKFYMTEAELQAQWRLAHAAKPN